MVTVDFSNLFRGEIGGNVRKIAAPNVISPLEDILKDILHVAEISRGDTFTTDFIESLTARNYVILNAWIALFGKHSRNIAGIGDSETICPGVLAHRSRIVFFTITYRSAHHVAIVSDNFKHCGFAGADVSP